MSVGSAPGQFALAVGAPVILMGVGLVWWGFGNLSKVPFAKDGELVFDSNDHDWECVVRIVAQKVRERFSL